MADGSLTCFNPVGVQTGNEHTDGHGGRPVNDKRPPTKSLQHVRVNNRHEKTHAPYQYRNDVRINPAANFLKQKSPIKIILLFSSVGQRCC